MLELFFASAVRGPNIVIKWIAFFFHICNVRVSKTELFMFFESTRTECTNMAEALYYILSRCRYENLVITKTVGTWTQSQTERQLKP